MVRGFLCAALVASVGVGCVDGVGVECVQHADCNGGLQCVKESGKEKGECSTCEDGVSCLGVDLVLQSCDQRVNPMDGTTALKVSILKEDGSTLREPEVVDLSEHKLPVPTLPLGEKLRIVVEALETPTSSVPKARGSTALFVSTAENPAPNPVIFMRAVGEFAPINGRKQPASCIMMNNPRAGHTATVLGDGRIFVVGGYSVAEDGKKGSYLASTEIIDLRKGQIDAGPSLRFARAGHSAAFIPASSAFPQGRVLIVGGETTITGTGGEQLVDSTLWAEVFDPAKPDAMALVRAKEQRMRHGAAVLSNGYVFVAGGTQTQKSQALNSSEFFNPNAAEGTEFDVGSPLATARSNPAVVALSDGTTFVIGGLDKQNAPLKSVESFSYDAGAGRFLPPSEATSLTLGAARFEPLAVPFALQDGPGILVVGKPQTNGTTPAEAFDILSPSGATIAKDIAATPRYREGACIAAFPGGAIVAGGQLAGIADLQDSTDLYTLNPDGKVRAAHGGKLTAARKGASCTSLPDGTVLVTGGQQIDHEGKPAASAIVEVYQPL